MKPPSNRSSVLRSFNSWIAWLNRPISARRSSCSTTHRSTPRHRSRNARPLAHRASHDAVLSAALQSRAEHDRDLMEAGQISLATLCHLVARHHRLRNRRAARCLWINLSNPFPLNTYRSPDSITTPLPNKAVADYVGRESVAGIGDSVVGSCVVLQIGSFHT